MDNNDVWESDQVDYDKKSMVREEEHTQRRMETLGYKDGVDLVNVDDARQKGFEDGFKIGALRGDYKGRLMGFCLGLETLGNVEILTNIVNTLEKMDSMSVANFDMIKDLSEMKDLIHICDQNGVKVPKE